MVNFVQNTKEDALQSSCSWSTTHSLLKKYHDEEWGIPVHQDKKHFEMLILEGAQAGLSWLTILKKRGNYRKLFKGFDPDRVAAMSDLQLEQCLQDSGIVRHRLKVYSVRKNAVAFIQIQQEFGSFDQYIWQFADQDILSAQSIEELPTETETSKTISKDLKRRGMIFVGSKIIYAYMQAVGLVNGHTTNCFRYPGPREIKS